MPIDLSPFLEPLPASTEPDLETVDERLVAIEALAEKARFDAAAEATLALVTEGIRDVRTLPYLFYQAFLEGGFTSLELVFRALANLVGPSYAALAPERRREEHVDRRLSWLFDKIQRGLEYDEKFGTPEWAALTKTLTPADIQSALGAAKPLSEQLVARDALRADQALAQLSAKLRSYEEGPRTPHGLTPLLTSASSPAADAKAPARAAAAASGATATAADASTQPLQPPVREGLYRMELVVPYAFVDLCRKLKAFETVIHKHQYQKAAVLAVEIEQIADSFDPRLYFPELFSTHAALHSKHAATLAREANDQETPIWRALARYARVDLDGFVES
jgi:hypothetical protein